MKVKRQVPQPAFEAGQKWRMEGVTCHIGQVGRCSRINLLFLKIYRVCSAMKVCAFSKTAGKSDSVLTWKNFANGGFPFHRPATMS